MKHLHFVNKSTSWCLKSGANLDTLWVSSFLGGRSSYGGKSATLRTFGSWYSLLNI